MCIATWLAVVCVLEVVMSLTWVRDTHWGGCIGSLWMVIHSCSLWCQCLLVLQIIIIGSAIFNFAGRVR
jgi:hypothetical protein